MNVSLSSKKCFLFNFMERSADDFVNNGEGGMECKWCLVTIRADSTHSKLLRHWRGDNCRRAFEIDHPVISFCEEGYVQDEVEIAVDVASVEEADERSNDTYDFKYSEEREEEDFDRESSDEGIFHFNIVRRRPGQKNFPRDIN
jgi:hypothetical protein